MAEIISAGPFATERERSVAEVLKQLPNDWTVICNKILPSGDRSYEIDFISDHEARHAQGRRNQAHLLLYDLCLLSSGNHNSR